MIVLKNGTIVATDLLSEYACTFPVQEVSLNRANIQVCGLEEGLAQLAMKLAAQYEDCEGVKIHNLGVTFLLNRKSCEVQNAKIAIEKAEGKP